MNRLRQVIVGLVFTLSLFNIAQAQHAGVFLGGSLGSTDDNVLNETDTGYKIFGGYRFNQNFAGEMAFVDLGSYAAGAVDQYGIAFDVMGILPVSEAFDLFGKVGLFAWSVDYPYPFVSEDGTDLMYGFGAQWNLSPQLGLRLEYEEFTDVSGGDVSLASAGVSFQF